MGFSGNNNTGNYLTISGNLLVPNPGSGNWTIMVWYKPASTSGWQNLWFLNNQYAVQVNTSTAIEFYHGSSQVNIATSINTSTWYHLTVSKTGTTNAKVYLNGTQVGSDITSGLSSLDTAASSIASWDAVNAASDYLVGSLAGMKIWGVQLASNEIMRESRALYPRRHQDLLAFYPFLTGGSSERVKNYLGTNGNLTQTGTSLADANGPPIQWNPQNYVVPFSSSGLVLSTAQVGSTIELTWS